MSLPVASLAAGGAGLPGGAVEALKADILRLPDALLAALKTPRTVTLQGTVLRQDGEGVAQLRTQLGEITLKLGAAVPRDRTIALQIQPAADAAGSPAAPALKAVLLVPADPASIRPAGVPPTTPAERPAPAAGPPPASAQPQAPSTRGLPPAPPAPDAQPSGPIAANPSPRPPPSGAPPPADAGRPAPAPLGAAAGAGGPEPAMVPRPPAAAKTAGGLASATTPLAPAAPLAPATPPGSPTGLSGAAGLLAQLLGSLGPLGRDATSDAAKPFAALRETLATLRAAAPAALPQLVSQALPQANAQLAATVLRFLAAQRTGDVRALLGEAAVEALEAAGQGGLVEQLGQELKAPARPPADPALAEGRLYTFPLYDQGTLTPVRLYVGPDPKEAEDGPDEGREAGRRLLIEIELSRLGPLQLDGLARTRRLDLTVRSRQPFPPELQDGMARVFAEACDGLGLRGSLSLGRAGWVALAPSSV